MFDVRFLKNPHWVPSLRPQTGKDRAVQNYMRRQTLTAQFLRRVTGFLRFLLPHYVDEGKAYLTVAIGCTGGRHRSVFVAEALKRELSSMDGITTRVRHRDMGRQRMIGIVVVTHGQLATELVNAAETIVGDLPQFAAVSIGWHEDVQDARDDIQSAIGRVKAAGSGVLILTDMFGGTPSQPGNDVPRQGSDRSRHRREPADADQGGQPARRRRARRTSPDS